MLRFSVMRPSIRNYFERNKKTAGDENDKIALSQNGIKRKRKIKHACVSRLLKKCKEQYQRKTPEQIERMRQEARKVYYLRKLESIVPPATYEESVIAGEWSQTSEAHKPKALTAAKCESRREQRINKLNKLVLPKRGLPRALMSNEELEAARRKAREAQRRKRAGLTTEEKEVERQKGRERMRQRRATMSEEEKHLLREIGKQRMRLKRASLNIEQKEKFCKKYRERRRNKWTTLNPEEQEARNQRRREKQHEKWASYTPEEKEAQRQKRRERQHKKWASYTPEEREAYRQKLQRYNHNYRSREAEKKGLPKRIKRPVDILSILRKSNAQLLVAEEAEPLPFASREHVNVALTSSTSSQCNDPLVEEGTQSAINSEQPSTEEQLQGTMNMECDDEQVTENMSLVGTASAEQSMQHHNDTVVVDQTCTPVVGADEVRWQFKDYYCGSTTLPVGQC